MLAQNSNKGAVESFMEEYVVQLSGDGIARNECYDKFKEFVAKNGFKYTNKKDTFISELLSKCEINKYGDRIQPAKNSRGVRTYRFSAEVNQR